MHTGFIANPEGMVSVDKIERNLNNKLRNTVNECVSGGFSVKFPVSSIQSSKSIPGIGQY